MSMTQPTSGNATRPEEADRPAGQNPATTGGSPPPPMPGAVSRSASSPTTPRPLARRSELQTERGRTSIADSVVAKIAGLAAREVAGVHEMGAGMTRTFGALRDRIGSNDNGSPTRGVAVEVGERQAAVDLDVVVEYGAAIVEVAESIRGNVISRVEDMTGLEVTEVNVTVDDVWLGDNQPPEIPEQPRVI